MRAESGKVNWNQIKEELSLVRSMGLPDVKGTIERFDIVSIGPLGNTVVHGHHRRWQWAKTQVRKMR